MEAVKTVRFSDDEILATITKYPGLSRVGPGVVAGYIDVYAKYQGVEIKDRFQVRITRANPVSVRLPALYETGGRTEAIAIKWRKRDTRDLHQNPQGNACVCVPQEEKVRFPTGADLSFFVDHLCSNYLYGLGYFDLYGRWPWGERSHGTIGILEYYADECGAATVEAIREVLAILARESNWRDYHRQLRRPSGLKSCLCGSSDAFQRCHPEAFAGIVYLGEVMDRLGMPRRASFDRARMSIKAS